MEQSSFVRYITRKLDGYRTHVTPHGVLVHADNIEIMDLFADDYFDLLLTDPPYGIGEDGASNHTRGKGDSKTEHSRRKALASATKFTPKDWDKSIPSPEYFLEAKRITKNQIIFGGNYFQSVVAPDKSNHIFVYNEDGEKEVLYRLAPVLGETTCWIVWDKKTGKTNFADCELAWTSFDTAVKRYEFQWKGMMQGNMKKKDKRIHPTQKPVQVMRYILRDYAEKGNKIVDTHAGSCTTAIACIDLDMNYLMIEQDEEYFEKASKRIEYFKYGYNSKLKDGNEAELPQASLKF